MPPTSSHPVKLHLGCGTNKLAGWINIDSVESCKPDLIHDLTQPLPYGDQSADDILAEDLLEHFDKYMRFVVFGDWARVLKAGGMMTVQVPNFKKILLRYFKFGFANFVDFIFGENMWRSEFYIGHFGNHKWGYSDKTLKEFVTLFGFEVQDIKTGGLNIRLVAKKVRHVDSLEIEKIMIYSHANRTGIGKPGMTVGEAREKIKIFQKK